MQILILVKGCKPNVLSRYLLFQKINAKLCTEIYNMSTLVTNESKYSISQYGMDMPIDALYKRLKDEDIIIPNFQRGYVWKQNEASRFIETILLRLPVPSIFLAKDKYTQKLIVVDGQQRLKTIMYFIDGKFQDGKKFKLSKVIDEYSGLGFDDLSMADRREFLNIIVHAIVIYEDEESNAIYDIFERINTSGNPLQNQEIRKAVYHGPFDSLITKLNNGNELWREMYGEIDDRRRDEEAILRGLALSFKLDSYDGKLKDFLNVFMLYNRIANGERLYEFKRIFDKTIEVIYHKIGKDAFRISNKRFSMTLLDSIFPAVAINLLEGKEIIEKLSDTVNEITGSKEFQEFMGGSTTSRKSMLERIHLLKNQIGV